MLPADGFIQAQTGFEIPFAKDHANEFFWRGLVGKSFVQGQFGRTWSPMIEVLGAQELADGEPALRGSRHHGRVGRHRFTPLFDVGVRSGQPARGWRITHLGRIATWMYHVNMYRYIGAEAIHA
jgi:hypothetical protein